MSTHRWKFFRAGGFDQVRLDEGADLAALDELDPKLWVALSCPTVGLEFDPHTLELLDTDKDGRVRVPEVIAAAKWATGLLRNRDDLARGAPTLALSAIADTTDEGKQLLAAARVVLKSLGKPTAQELSPADTADAMKILAATIFNGDGIVLPEAAEGDAETTKVLGEILATVGGDKDLSGKDGVSAAKVSLFFEQAAAFLAWAARPEKEPELVPLGAGTGAAADAVRAVRARVDDYFARCALAALDERAKVALNPSEAQYAALGAEELSAGSATIAKLPLARAEAGRPLPLRSGVNPAWAEAIGRLRADAVIPLLGEREHLSHDSWLEVTKKLGPYEAWQAAKPAQAVEKLGAARLREVVSGPARAAIDALIAKDLSFAPETQKIASVDRLVHYHRDLATFLNNFVTFRDFYTKRAKAIFQVGTLYLDGRSCELCMRVTDAGKHAALAGQAMTFLAYCDCVRKGGGEKMSIVAAFTGGDGDFVVPGRNGVFYDRKGDDWDATVTKVVDQPISLRQAAWSPYKRIGKFISDQVEKFAGAADKSAASDLEAGVTAAAARDASKPAAAPFDVAKFAGIFAAIGLALGAIGTALAAVVTGFLGLSWWQMPIAVLGVGLVISGPSMLLAGMKLRQRNLGPLLDASGWAINARARINIPFGRSLTHLAELPDGAERAIADPYAEQKRPWLLWLFLLVIAGAAAYWYLVGMPMPGAAPVPPPPAP